MDYAKCPACKGAKKIKGLGQIEKNCPTCNGIGYSEMATAKEEKYVAPVNKVKRKWTRKANSKLAL